MPEEVPIEKLKDYIGQEMGISDWVVIDQNRINTFAECTGDHQWIHVDVEKAKEGPFGNTIAHGYLSLSLIPALSGEMKVVPEGVKMGINYGLNKVRFLKPVVVGSRVRNKAVLKDVTIKGDGRILICIENTLEIEGEDTPAFVAEALAMYFT